MIDEPKVLTVRMKRDIFFPGAKDVFKHPEEHFYNRAKYVLPVALAEYLLKKDALEIVG